MVLRKQVISWLLALAMVITMIPSIGMTARADGSDQGGTEEYVEVSTIDQFKDAINAGETHIKLMADIDYDGNAGSLTIPEDLNLTLDTNGYTFSRYRTYSSTYTPYEKVPVNPVIVNKGTLTINGGGTIEGGAEAFLASATSDPAGVINNTGDLILNDVNIHAMSADELNEYYTNGGTNYHRNRGVVINNKKNLTINGGTYDGGSNSFIGGGVIENSFIHSNALPMASFKMTGGTINGNLTILAKNFEVSGGTVNGNFKASLAFREEMEENNVSISNCEINGELQINAWEGTANSGNIFCPERSNVVLDNVQANSINVSNSVVTGTGTSYPEPNHKPNIYLTMNNINDMESLNISGETIILEQDLNLGGHNFASLSLNGLKGKVVVDDVNATGTITLKNIETENTLSNVKCSILKLSGTSIDTLDNIETDKGTYTSGSMVYYYGIETDKGLTCTNCIGGSITPKGTQNGQTYNIGEGCELERILSLDGSENVYNVYDGATIDSIGVMRGNNNKLRIGENSSVEQLGGPRRPVQLESIEVNNGSLGVAYIYGRDTDLIGEGQINSVNYMRTSDDGTINVEQPTTIKRIRQYSEATGATGTVTVNLPDGYVLDEEGYVKKDILSSVYDLTIEGINESYEWTGEAITPQPIVKVIDNNKITTLTDGEDYDVEFSNNVNVGQASAKIIFKGDWLGEQNVPFQIAKKVIAEDGNGNPYTDIDEAIDAIGDDGLIIITDPSVSPIDTGDSNIRVKNGTDEPIIVNGVTVDPGDTYDPNNVIVAKDDNGNGYTNIDDAINETATGHTMFVKDPSVSPIDTGDKKIKVKNDTNKPIVVNGTTVDPGDTYNPSNPVVAKDDEGNSYNNIDDAIDGTDEDGTLIIKDPSVSPIDTGDKDIKVKNDTDEPIVVNGVTVDPGDIYDPEVIIVAKDQDGNPYTDIQEAIDAIPEGGTLIVKDPSVSPIDIGDKNIDVKNDTTKPIVVNGTTVDPGDTYHPADPTVAKDDEGNSYNNIDDAIDAVGDNGTVIVKDPSVSPIATDEDVNIKNDTNEDIVVNGETVKPGETINTGLEKDIDELDGLKGELDGISSDDPVVQDAINSANEAINDAEDAYGETKGEKAQSDPEKFNEAVQDAKDKVEEAKEAIQDAIDAYKDSEVSGLQDAVFEGKDLIDAMDPEFIGEEGDVKDAVDKAKEDLDTANEAVNDLGMNKGDMTVDDFNDARDLANGNIATANESIKDAVDKYTDKVSEDLSSDLTKASERLDAIQTDDPVLQGLINAAKDEIDNAQDLVDAVKSDESKASGETLEAAVSDAKTAVNNVNTMTDTIVDAYQALTVDGLQDAIDEDKTTIESLTGDAAQDAAVAQAVRDAALAISDAQQAISEAADKANSGTDEEFQAAANAAIALVETANQATKDAVSAYANKEQADMQADLDVAKNDVANYDSKYTNKEDVQKAISDANEAFDKAQTAIDALSNATPENIKDLEKAAQDAMEAAGIAKLAADKAFNENKSAVLEKELADAKAQEAQTAKEKAELEKKATELEKANQAVKKANTDLKKKIFQAHYIHNVKVVKQKKRQSKIRFRDCVTTTNAKLLPTRYKVYIKKGGKWKLYKTVKAKNKVYKRYNKSKQKFRTNYVTIKKLKKGKTYKIKIVGQRKFNGKWTNSHAQQFKFKQKK